MRFTFRIMLFCISFLLFLHTSFVFAESKVKVRVGDKIPNFVLEDAYEKRYELKQMRGKAIILIFGSRKTEENNDRWREMLEKAFPKNDSLQIFSVGDMQGIPFFITKGFVRGKVKEMIKKGEVPVAFLLDWDQKANKLLGADKDSTDIFAIDPVGVLLSHQVGLYTEEKFSILKSKIEEALKSNKNDKTENDDNDKVEEDKKE